MGGKVILVTGAASGIGMAAARGLAASGASVVATDLGETAAIQDTIRLAEPHMAASLDVVDEAAVASVVAAALERFGRLDGVVNSAGIVCNGTVHATSRSHWERGLAIHLTGSYLVCKHAVVPMLEVGSGAIVLVSSVYGMTGCTGNVPYNVAKGGVLQLMRSMAADYGPNGIRVNAVSPGLITTPMTAGAMGDTEAAFTRMHPLGRAGRPDEVAAAISFLLSDAASFISGANLPVDGGFSASRCILSS